MKKLKKLALVLATDFEAKPFIKGFSLKKIEDGPFLIYGINEIYLIISGIGKVNSSIAASYLIVEHGITHLFNLGACGSTNREYGVGDILHINRVLDYDRPKLLNMKPRFIKPHIITGFRTAGLSTQDRPVIGGDDRKKIGQYAELVDMEGAGFLQACKVFSKKSYLFKIVTDTPEHQKNLDIIMNIKRTAPVMYKFFKDEVFRKFNNGDM
ncbi:hypothetical protein ACFL20_05370 [Spirochaetota bacterium]